VVFYVEINSIRQTIEERAFARSRLAFAVGHFLTKTNVLGVAMFLGGGRFFNRRKIEKTAQSWFSLNASLTQ